VLKLEDGTMAPLDYKFAKYEELETSAQHYSELEARKIIKLI